MTLWQRIKSWFGFKPKAAPSKFGSSYDFNDDHYIGDVDTAKTPTFGTIGINNSSTRDKAAIEKNGVFVKDGVLSAGSQRNDFPNTQPVRRPTPVRSYGESECNHNYSARIGGVTTSSLRPDGSFIDGMFTGYMVGEALEAVGNMISGDRDQGFTETRSAPEPAYVAPTPSTDWGTPASTNFGESNTTSWGGGSDSSWVSDVADSVSSAFSD